MSSNRVRVFQEIENNIKKMNELLDEVLSQYEKGNVNETLINDITDLIDAAYKIQLKLLGAKV